MFSCSFDDTLAHRSNDRNADIILGHELRSEKDLEFWKYIGTIGFEFEKVHNKDLDPFWQAEEIGVFHVKKRKKEECTKTKTLHVE